MKYIVEKDLSEFEFWQGGRKNAELLTEEELDTIDERIDEILGSTPTEKEINDLFWCDFDEALDLLGYHIDGDTGEIIREKEEDEEDEKKQ